MNISTENKFKNKSKIEDINKTISLFNQLLLNKIVLILTHYCQIYTTLN